ncbi:MAG: protein adenylyltransferase SelO family protein, partial [Parazoarcus communis]
FGHQPKIAHWNLWQLANALYPALKDAKGLEAALEAYSETYTRESQRMTADKLGLEVWQDGDGDQVERLHRLLEVNEVDMSLFYRALAVFDPDRPDFSVFDDAFYDPEKRDAARPEFEAWLADYAARLSAQGVPQALRQERMNAVNPLYVPRNYLAQQAIDLAEKGDLSGVHTLLDVFRRPYEQQPGREAYAAKRPDWARVRPGCSMLSCSS